MILTTPSYDDIYYQAASLERTAAIVASIDLAGLDGSRQWLFVGCGASYHAATAAAGLFNTVSRSSAFAAPSSDLWMNPEAWLRDDSVVVGLSRTGTTTETVEALRTASRLGATTVGVSLTPSTPLLEDADLAVLLDHVGEVGRVMTRSFSNLLLTCQGLAVRAVQGAGARVDGGQIDNYLTGLGQVGPAVAGVVSQYDSVARDVASTGSGHVVFLGSGPNVGICRQAALQTQETARAAVEAHAVLDYRHGPLASLTPDSTVVILTDQRSRKADLVIAGDLAELGGHLVVSGPAEIVEQFPEHVRKVPFATTLPRWLQGNLCLPFLQLLAYHLTVARGADPESVHNLDRSKTPHVNPHVLPDDLLTNVPA